MDISHLVAVLQGCMSPDQNTRSAAEQALTQYESNPGQAVQLLRVAAEASADVAVRQAAAISFKNLVKKGWEGSEGKPAMLSEEDKGVVRQNLLEILIHAPHIVQTQLGEVFKMIVYCDYPQQWPGLLQELVKNLMTHEQARLHGGLMALRILARKYEFRDEEERTLYLKDIVNTTFPVLLHIFQQLLAAEKKNEQVPLLMKLVLKTFWSSTYMEVPDLLLTPDQFNGWMTCLHSAITMPVPMETMPHDKSEWQNHVWWKAKKWVLHISYRMISRYGEPRHFKEADKEKAFSAMWSEQCSLKFLEAIMHHAAALASGAYLSPRAVNLTLQYLQQAVDVKSCYEAMAPHWDNLLHNVVYPLMCFDDNDQQMWEEDPQEYVRKGYDMLEEVYSPKTAATNFAHTLCEKKKAHLDRFMAFLVPILVSSAPVMAAGGPAAIVAARKVDGALLAVGGMADLLKRKQPYKTQLPDMLIGHVLPLFGCPYGHLRAKAAWVSGIYCDISFRDGKGAGTQYTTMLQAVMNSLLDPELPVKVDSVVAIRHFIEDIEDISSIKPVIPQLLDSIFHLMNQVDADDVVFTLEAIVEKFENEIAPFAVMLSQNLVAAFWKYSQTAEEEDDDMDAAGIAAFGCVRAMNTLLESCSSLSHLFPALEEIFFPVMQRMISTDGQDILEDVLEMLAYFTFYSASISERLWTLWPQLHNVVTDFGIDYWENILVPLDNFISRDTERFLTSQNPNYVASAMHMATHSLTGDFNDRDVVSAAKLLEVILQNCRGRVHHLVPQILALVMQRLTKGVESRTLQDQLFLVIANALYYDATLTLSTLVQAGAVSQVFTAWFGMIFADKRSGKGKHFRRMHDKKMCVLGLVTLLTAPDEILPPEVRAGLPQVSAGILRLLVALKGQKDEADKQREEGSDDEEDEEEEEELDDDVNDEARAKEDEEYLAKLSKVAQDLIADNHSDSDDEWTDDEEIQTPLDSHDPFILASDALLALQTQNPGRYAQVVIGLDANNQAALVGMHQYAQQLKQESSKASA